MKKINTITLLLLAAVFHASAQNMIALQPGESESAIVTKAANVIPTQRQLDWQKLEVTGFLHFGINTFTNKEWGEGKDDPKLLNPTQLDAEQWVRTAKEGGIKLLILTAKHHDGFCLWQTNTTDYSVKNSPYKKGKGDIFGELAAACKKYDMKLGVYLSPWDRHEASYGSEAYNDFFVAQLSELLTRYGQIDEVWFDGANGEGPNGKKQEYDWNRYYQVIREKQPEAVIAVMGPDVRWVGTETGYGRDTEWSVVPASNLAQNQIAAGSQQQMNIKPAGDMRNKDLGSRERIKEAKGLVWYPAETDVSIRPGWFYHEEEDNKVKSPGKLMDIYFNSVGKNGVLLLNIPPTTAGLIHSVDAANLKKWNDWRTALFSKNLLSKAKLHTAGLVLKKWKKMPFWTTKDEKNSIATFEYTLPKATAFNVLSLQETIALGQRVERFNLEIWQDGVWREVSKGTTIGNKRLLTFPTVSAQRLRINILQSRLNPQIEQLGLYFNERGAFE